MKPQIVRIDKIKWWITKSTTGGRLAVPLCPEHDLRMTMSPGKKYDSRLGRNRDEHESEVKKLECAEGPHFIDIPRGFKSEKKYVIDRIAAKEFKKIQTVDLDGELTPIAKEKLKSADDKRFVVAQLMESKRGLQLVVYAGEKGSKKKAQIFIEPEVKRLAFDQNDLNPSDVFVELRATFADGSSHEIKRGKK